MAKTQTVLNFGMVAIPAKLQSATDKAKRLNARTIEVVEFLDNLPDHIDERRYADSYFLTPQETGVKAFALFLTAMRQTGVVAIAKLTYRKRERLSVVRPYNGVMLLQTLHRADELPAEPEGVIAFDTNTLLGLVPKEVAISDCEEYQGQMELAQKLIRGMTTRPYTMSAIYKGELN